MEQVQTRSKTKSNGSILIGSLKSSARSEAGSRHKPSDGGPRVLQLTLPHIRPRSLFLVGAESHGLPMSYALLRRPNPCCMWVVRRDDEEAVCNVPATARKNTLFGTGVVLSSPWLDELSTERLIAVGGVVEVRSRSGLTDYYSGSFAR